MPRVAEATGMPLISDADQEIRAHFYHLQITICD